LVEPKGEGGGIDRTIVFERHCPQYSDKTGRKKLPCYLTKADDKKWKIRRRWTR